jgi:hypothetical protein
LWGGYRFAAGLPDRVQQARLDEGSQRQASWSPISGFAEACRSNVPTAAGVLLLDITATPLAADAVSRTGPEVFGGPYDVDWPNQAAFAYALYPRSVVAMGHLPSASPVGASARFVALWDQVSYRSGVARADTAAALRQLLNIPRVSVVCSYSDPLGDHGWLFAMPGAASVEPGAGSPSPSLTGAGLALTLLGLACLWVIGAMILGGLGLSNSRPGLWASAALPMGCAAITVEMLVFSVSGIRWSLPPLLIPWSVPGALILWNHRALARRMLAWRPGLARIDRYELAGFSALIGILVVVAGASPLVPPQSDGFNLYYFKANAFFNDGSVIPYYGHAADLLFSFPGHPPLVPLIVSWLYLFIGHVQERSTLLLWPALYASLLGSLYVLVRTRTGRKFALAYVLTAAFVAPALLGEAAGSGYTDMPLALYLLLGAGCLWLWAHPARDSWVLVAVSGVFLGAALMTKEEGLVATLAVAAATPLLRWSRRGVSWDAIPPALSTAAVAAAVASPWIALRLVYRLPVLTVDLGSKVDSVVHRLLPAAVGLSSRAGPQLAVAIVVVVAAIIAVRRGRQTVDEVIDRPGQFVASIALMMLAGDMLALAMAPVGIDHQVSIAGTRLVSQAVPLLLLALVQPWRVVVAAAFPGQGNGEGQAEQRDDLSRSAAAADRPAVHAGSV